MDDSSNPKGARVGIVLEGPGNLTVEQFLNFGFKTSNNQAEYEALLARLELALDMGAECLVCNNDSQLMVGHLSGEFQVKDPLLLQYYHRAQTLLQKFTSVKVVHIKREPCYLSWQVLSKGVVIGHLFSKCSPPPSVSLESTSAMVVETEKVWFEPIKHFIVTGDYQGERGPVDEDKEC